MLAVLALAATAFTAGPAAVRTRSPSRACAVRAGSDGMVGACPPLGYFDPLGLGKDPDRVKYYREAELKHGRVAMLACFGWFTTANGFHPLLDLLKLEPASTPLADAYNIPSIAWAQIFAFNGVVEGFSLLLKKNPGYIAGDYLGASEYMDSADQGWQRYQLAEINNGRLAMMGIMGLLAESAIYDKTLLLFQ